MSAEDLYREVILDHHRRPRCAAPLLRENALSSGMNPSCGDEVSVHLDIQDERIEGIQVESKGCAVSTAAGSMFADKSVGMSIAEVRALADAVRTMLTTGVAPAQIDMGDLEALAGVNRFPVRIKCAMLPIATVLSALATLEGRRKDTVS